MENTEMGIEGHEEYIERRKEIVDMLKSVIPWATKDFEDMFVETVITIVDGKKKDLIDD